jgi:hypothetical protein
MTVSLLVAYTSVRDLTFVYARAEGKERIGQLLLLVGQVPVTWFPFEAQWLLPCTAAAIHTCIPPFSLRSCTPETLGQFCGSERRYQCHSKSLA